MKKITKIVMVGLLGFGSTVCAAQGLTVCTSTSYTIPSAEDVPSATYKWLENGVEVAGATDESYTNMDGKSAGTYVYVRMAHTAACGWQNSNAFIVYVAGSVNTPTITKPDYGCAGSDYVFTVPVVSGTSYEWSGGGAANSNSYTYANAAAGAQTVTVHAFTEENGVICRSAAASASVTAFAAPVISSQPAGIAICASNTATLSVTASPVTAYQWKKNGEDATGTSASYDTEALTTTTTYSVVVSNVACSVTSDNAVVSIKTEGCGIFQPQGSCTYTEPAVVGTFANFPSDYTSGTYVSLRDERDNKIYPVVKIGTRWIMAWNLNYQEGLTWYANSAEPSTGSGSNKDLRGVFWCPGGNSSSTGTSSSYSCEMWGALYAWETAMMLDGKGTWTEAAKTTYNTGAANAAGSKINQGRTASTGSGYGGRGICPPSWHVPTDNEWGIILDGMEDGASTAHQNASGYGYYGTNAGKYSRSTCTTTNTSGSGVSDMEANWYYDTDNTKGTDKYGFRVLPAGRRLGIGSSFNYRGNVAFFWSSSAYDGSVAWIRYFFYNDARVNRYYYYRSIGYSVRCIRD